MTGSEIVKKTLAFENPVRVACAQDFLHCDHRVKTYATDWTQMSERHWERKDEWGNTWERLEATSKGEVTRGVLEDVSIETYEFPDFSRFEDYQNVAEQRAAKPDLWMNCWMPGFTFNVSRKLMRLENYLADLLLEPELMHALHDKVDVVLTDMIVNYAKAGAQSIMFPEDWGTQTQTLISPACWREEFFPRFQKLCGLAHDLGMKVFMHSCGAIAGIIPGLIEAGVDLLQFDQPTLHGIDNLAAYQKDAKITFWCPVDIQKTLQTKNEALIRAEARELLDKLWRGRGGFVAGHYGDNASIGLEPIWQEIADDEFMRYGKCK